MKKYLVIFFVATFVACNNKQQAEVRQEDNTANVPADDKEMREAITSAKNTYPSFLQQFRNPDSASDFSVKMRFEYGEGEGEHMWLGNLYFNDDKLYGVLGDEPVKINNVHAGDSLEIVESRLSDWMYIKNHKLVGGYTIKAIYSKMSEQEKKEFREGFPFELE